MTDFHVIQEQLEALDLESLQVVRNMVNHEIGHRERQENNRLLKEGWWVEEFGTADNALNDSQKCKILGIMHPKYNPHGERPLLFLVKQLRVQFNHTLTECKQLVDAYKWEVESWKARPPEVDEGSE
ncbi:MAG: hypothetical protein ACYSW8_32060 [Planctomycetota bacterium]|jgi:hypothetical protein